MCMKTAVIGFTPIICSSALSMQYIADYDEERVNMRQVAGVLEHISTALNYIRQDELNADETIINFHNGLLKVSATGTELFPHSPEVFSTIQLPCEWSEQATQPLCSTPIWIRSPMEIQW